MSLYCTSLGRHLQQTGEAKRNLIQQNKFLPLEAIPQTVPFLPWKKKKQRKSPPTLFQENRVLSALCTHSPVCYQSWLRLIATVPMGSPRSIIPPGNKACRNPVSHTSEKWEQEASHPGTGAGEDAPAAFEVWIPNVRHVLIKTFGLQCRIFLSLLHW